MRIAISFAHDAMRAVAAHARLGARDGRRGAAIVDGALLEQALDSGRDGGVGVALFGEARAHLAFRELSRGQPSERAEIGGFGRIGIGGRAGLVHRPDFIRRTS